MFFFFISHPIGIDILFKTINKNRNKRKKREFFYKKDMSFYRESHAKELYFLLEELYKMCVQKVSSPLILMGEGLPQAMTCWSPSKQSPQNHTHTLITASFQNKTSVKTSLRITSQLHCCILSNLVHSISLKKPEVARD